jgi:hypothetical protein
MAYRTRKYGRKARRGTRRNRRGGGGPGIFQNL